MTILRALGALAALAGTSGCLGNMAIFKDVDLTVAKLAPPITDVKPEPDSATVVIAYPGPLEGGRQAQTVALINGTFVAQVTTRSFAVVRLPPGKHLMVWGVPELDRPAWCNAMGPFDLAAGKVYVLIGGTLAVPTTAEAPEPQFDRATLRALSLFTHLTVDGTAGTRAMKANPSFWAECFEEADNRRIELGVPAPPSANAGVAALQIPAPP